MYMKYTISLLHINFYDKNWEKERFSRLEYFLVFKYKVNIQFGRYHSLVSNINLN